MTPAEVFYPAVSSLLPVAQIEDRGTTKQEQIPEIELLRYGDGSNRLRATQFSRPSDEKSIPPHYLFIPEHEFRLSFTVSPSFSVFLSCSYFSRTSPLDRWKGWDN